MTDAHGLLEQLVAFPSVAGRPNDEVAGFIAGWLRGHGIECAEVRGASGRVNLLASTGPAAGGVLLAAHMDVVEVEGQAWNGDPWRLRRHGERLVGRGSADMKGFLACAMRAMADAAAVELREPLRLAVSTDEEIGCVGVRDLLPVIEALPQRPRACLVGEPTGMRLVTAHKGKLALRATLHGSARHSSEAPRADNAVEHAAELVLALRDRGRELAHGRRDRRFAIPHSTISVGPIHGGRALNVVPDHCTVEFEVRNLPGDDPASLLSGIGNADLERLAAYPALDGEPGALCDWLGVAAGDAIDFGTEAGLYARLGIATAVCGPGDIGDAHRADESIAIEQLDACSTALGRLLTHLTQGSP
ncbi:MAG TPA: acetylornithine deacetylase [Gaiellales bacterium]|nr:acetylornithine deacetylase [Gaiellales bacterium]